MLPPRRHEISRLEAFSDAVFAFALTLLVVSLDVPSSLRRADDADGRVRAIRRVFRAADVDLVRAQRLLQEVRPAGSAHRRDQRRPAVRRAVLRLPAEVPVHGGVLASSSRCSVSGSESHHRSWRRIFAIYGAGFVVLFTMFALLYLQVYRKRDELGLDALETFDVRASLGAHLVSAGVGAVASADRALRALSLPCPVGLHLFPDGTLALGLRRPLRPPPQVARGTPRGRGGSRGERLTDAAQRRSHPPVDDPARPRSVAAPDHRRPGRAHRRDDAHDPPRSRGPAVGRVPAVRRDPRRQEVLDARSRRRSAVSTRPVSRSPS